MAKAWFKRPQGKWERAFVLPSQAAGHFIFALLLAIIFVNLRIAAVREGMTGIVVDALLGGLSLLLTAFLLNLLPKKFIEEGKPKPPSSDDPLTK